MNDYILRASANDGKVRAFIATTKNMVEEARSIHNTTPVVSAALGRTLTATAIMGLMLKNDKDLVTISIKGDGPVGGLLATADSKARVKGYPFEPIVDMPLKENGKLDVAGAIGAGDLRVIMDSGMKEPYVGHVPIVSGEIAEDITYYFAASEQIPSAVALGVLVDVDYSIKSAGGFIIQLMPGADENLIEDLEKTIASLPAITTLLSEGKTPEDILEIILGSYGTEVLDKNEVRYYCNCSKERVEKALISIGRKDLEEILSEDKQAELNCHFCNKKYMFDEDDLKDILERIK